MRTIATIALGLTLVTAVAVRADDSPMAFTRQVLERSNQIVRGPEDRKQKLATLSDLLRGFLDTDALARLAAEKHLEGRSDAEVQEFLGLFHDFFVRTYVQRLLLFDAPDFAYDKETSYFGSEVRGELFKLTVSEFEHVLAIAKDGTYRIMNEVPTVLMLIIVFSVILRY